MSLQLNPLIVQVIKTLMELLDERGVPWTDGEVPQQGLTNLLVKHKISDCMELSSPYTRSKSVCGTFLKALGRLLSQADLEKDVWEWVNGDLAPPKMKERLETLFARNHDVGVKGLLMEEDDLLSLPESLTSKQALGKACLHCM